MHPGIKLPNPPAIAANDPATIAPGDRFSGRLNHGQQRDLPKSTGVLELSNFEPKETPYRLGTNHPRLDWKRLDVREQVILTALLRQYLRDRFPGDPHTVGTEYSTGKSGREYSLKTPSAEDLKNLVNEFKEDPRIGFATIRRNLIAIAKDPGLSEKIRMHRLENYFDASVTVTLVLDDLAFQHGHAESDVKRGAPPYYLPNGFVDLGLQPHLAPAHRNREKITVDKGALLADTRPFLLTSLWNASKNEGGNISIKTGLLRDTATWVAGKISYGNPHVEPVTDPVDRRLDEGVGVCRNYAITTQLLNQQLGLNSRLIKVDFSMSAELHGEIRQMIPPARHAANLVRLDKSVSLLDVTRSDHGRIRIYDIDRVFALKTLHGSEPASFQFDGPGKVYANYTLKNDGFWTIRSLEKLESRKPEAAIDDEITR